MLFRELQIGDIFSVYSGEVIIESVLFKKIADTPDNFNTEMLGPHGMMRAHTAFTAKVEKKDPLTPKKDAK